MRLGIDLDGVCYDFAGEFTRLASILSDQPLPYPVTWNFYKHQWGWTEERYLRTFGFGVTEGNLFWRGAPTEGCVGALRGLRDIGHEVIIVTHRDHPERRVADAMRRATLYWLQNHDIPVDGILFEGIKTNTGIDLLVDDAPHNIMAAKHAGEWVIAFDRPWNTHVPASLRAGSWKDVTKMVEKLSDAFK